MSLYIDVDHVTSVLLVDGWHDVAEQTFTLDAYEFHWRNEIVVGGGQVEGVPSTGAKWKDFNGIWIACPLTAVLGVKLAASADGAGQED